MLIPYSTDAPLYHWPIATVSIIVANVVIFFSTTFLAMIGVIEYEQIDWLLIQFNQINPVQWITGAFMHLGIGHLFGNMFFLFCFGLVVEGKVGSGPYLGLYFASCILIGAVAQIPMFLMGDETAAAGASGVISTLMVIALIWAPENEISFFYFFIPFTGTFDARIMTCCVFFIGMDLFSLVMNGFSMSGAMGHTLGALLGVPFGFYYLRTGKVDCEGWDIISRNDWLKEYPLLYGGEQRRRDLEKEDDIENPVESALALGGGDVSRSSVIGLPSVRPKPKAAGPAKPKSPTKTSARKRRKQRLAKETPEYKAKVCQAHPEFNRLAFVLRQYLQSGNLPAAQKTFQQIDTLKIALGLGEKTLMGLSSQLAAQKMWIDAIRPLAIVIEKRSEYCDDACLRLAQIQLRVLKRPDQAVKTLDKMCSPVEDSRGGDRTEKLQQRGRLLQEAKQLGAVGS